MLYNIPRSLTERWPWGFQPQGGKSGQQNIGDPVKAGAPTREIEVGAS
ncbi:MAG: hypothetical protein QG639_50 [Patescibacteria group bacterium]|nr:hypothetical protein [Patescibacteria group bacterium]